MSSKKEICSHTALRGWAALLVVLFHFRSFLHPSVHPDQMTFLFAKSYLWVDFFFILSGFVLSYVYGIEQAERRTPRDITHYLIARLARIYPLHLVSLAAVLLFFIAGALISWGRDGAFCCVFDGSFRSAESLVANLFLIHAWGVFSKVTWNIPSWSISSEFFCYLIFAALLAMEGKTRQVALVALSCAALLYYGFYLVTRSSLDESFRFSCYRAASAFSVGIVLFLGRRVISGISERCLTSIQIAASIALFLALHIGLADVVSIGLMALIVLVTWEDRGSLCNWLATRYVHAVGLFSYSVYMWHYPIKFVALKDWERYTGLPLQSSAAGSIIFVICLMALVITISVWSYRFLEIPARRRISFQLNCLFAARHTPTPKNV